MRRFFFRAGSAGDPSGRAPQSTMKRRPMSSRGHPTLRKTEMTNEKRPREEAGSCSDRTIRSFRAAPNSHSIQIYNPDDLRRAIRELEGDEDWDDGGYVGPSQEKPSQPTGSHALSSEDANRLKHLQRVARCKLGPRRSLILGSGAMIERLAAIKAEAPHFAAFIDLVSRAARVSMRTRTPLHLPPLLLVGAPGIGKTFVLKRVAAAIGSHFELLSMNTLDSFRLRGLNTAWKGARMGKVAEALLGSPTASPVLLLDELEKMPQLNTLERPFDPFLSFFEEENATCFVDDYLEFPLRLDHVIWIASANDTAGIPAPILDRLLILEIPSPTRSQLEQIVEGIYATARERYAGYFKAPLSDDVRRLLARHNPRRLKRIITLAMGYAATETRDALIGSDVERALVLADHTRVSGFQHPVGFTRKRD